jgi:hypothetical protein
MGRAVDPNTGLRVSGRNTFCISITAGSFEKDLLG